ncbi:MAG: hypothetical protein HQL67_03435 [Magnetococcales bacterium]|nr:hypothetical protein [Magnetococcales bacterium]
MNVRAWHNQFGISLKRISGWPSITSDGCGNSGGSEALRMNTNQDQQTKHHYRWDFRQFQGKGKVLEMSTEGNFQYFLDLTITFAQKEK